MNALRLAPTIFDAANFKSSICSLLKFLLLLLGFFNSFTLLSRFFSYFNLWVPFFVEISLVEVIAGIQTVKAQNVELRSRWKWQERYTSYVMAGFQTVITFTAAD